jgi:hypothetical protein
MVPVQKWKPASLGTSVDLELPLIEHYVRYLVAPSMRMAISILSKYLQICRAPLSNIGDASRTDASIPAGFCRAYPCVLDHVVDRGFRLAWPVHTAEGDGGHSPIWCRGGILNHNEVLWKVRYSSFFMATVLWIKLQYSG